MFNIQFSLRLYFTLISYHNEIRLNPCHLSVCSKRFPSILQLWLMLPVNIMKMQLIFSSNFFSPLLTPKSKRTPTPALLAQLWLRSWWCCCNIMTPAVCPVSQSSWGSWGIRVSTAKKKCWCLLWGIFYEGGATIAAAQGSLMLSFSVPVLCPLLGSHSH